MRKFSLLPLLLVLFLTWFMASCSAPQNPLVVATYTYHTNNRVDNLSPFSAVLETNLNTTVITKSYPDVASLINATRSGEVDIAFINTFGYLMLAQDNPLTSPVAALQVSPDALDNYKTVLLASKSSGIIQIDQLKTNAAKLSMTFVNAGSTSGNMVPRLFLSSIGLNNPENDFQEVRYSGNHTSAFNELLQEDTDLAAFGSNEYFTRISADSSLLNYYTPLWLSPEIPLGPVMLKNDLPASQKEEISRLLLHLHISEPEALEQIKAGWSEAKQATHFQEISDEYYDSFRDFDGRRADLQEILERFAK